MNINPPQYFEKTFKPLKIFYNNEMRWILKAPSSYWSLCQSICEAFENNLPNFWTLQYADTDGDLIFLANNDDYEGMIEDMLENSPTVKIYVRPVDKRSRKLSVENIRILAAPKEDIPCYQPIPDQEELLVKLDQPEQPEEEEKEGKKEEEDLSDSFERLMENEEVINIYNSGDSSISFSKVSESEEGKPKADIREISLSGTSFEKLEKELSLDQELEKLSKKSLSVDMETKKEDIVKQMVGDTLDLDIPIIPLMNEKGRGQDSSSFFSFNGGEGNNYYYKMRKERPIHEDTICSGCGMNPILGVRYNCPICKDVDYCEKCEGKFEHPHPFFKIKNANHNPKDVVSLIVAENIIEAEGLSKNMKDEMAPIVNFLREKLFGTKEPEVREDLEGKEDREVNFLREKLFGTKEPEVTEDFEGPIEEVKEGEKLDKSFSFHESEIVCEKSKNEEPSESSSDSKIEMTKYPQRVYDLAKEVLEIFPDADLDGLLDFIDRSPKLTLSDIIENFMLL